MPKGKTISGVFGLDRIKRGQISGEMVADYFAQLAVQAEQMNAASTEVTMGFVDDDDQVGDRFVPELVFRVRHPREGEGR